MGWVDTVNLLVNMGKGFRERGMQSQALSSQAIQNIYDRKARAGEQNAGMIFQGLSNFGAGLGAGITEAGKKEQEMKVMREKQAFESAEAEKERGFEAAENLKNRTFTGEQNLASRTLTTEENELDRAAQVARDKFAREGYVYKQKEWLNPWNGQKRYYDSTNEGEHDINLKDINAWIEKAKSEWEWGLHKEDIDNEDGFRRALAEEAEIIDRYIEQNKLIDLSNIPPGGEGEWAVYEARTKILENPMVKEQIAAALRGLARRYPKTWAARTQDGQNIESVKQTLFPLRGKPDPLGLDYSPYTPTKTSNVSASASAAIPERVNVLDSMKAMWATATGLLGGKSVEQLAQDPRLQRIAEKRQAKEGLKASGIDKNEEKTYQDLLTAKDTIDEWHTVFNKTPSGSASTAINNINDIVRAMVGKDLNTELKKYNATFKSKYGLTAEDVLKQMSGYYAQNWIERSGEQEYYSGANEKYKPSSNLLQAFNELAALLRGN